LTDRTYERLNQLIENPPPFDVFVTGSDQVWRPSLLNREIGDIYHLCFASPRYARLVSYAPSFGVNRIPKQYHKRISHYLKRYHALSIREKQGNDIIFNLIGKKATQVLDPTLLLTAEDYDSILQTPPSLEEYILVYPMELGNGKAFLHLVKAIKRIMNLPVVCAFPLNFDFRWLLVADRVILDAGPREFLGLFKNASFICTNSFHGTVFSLIYKKSFLSMRHSTSNSRIQSLLEITGLLNRQLNDLDIQSIEEALDDTIDYVTVMQKLQFSIDHSMEFLENALAA
jgi:hypothetical protein